MRRGRQVINRQRIKIKVNPEHDKQQGQIRYKWQELRDTWQRWKSDLEGVGMVQLVSAALMR